MAEKVVFRCVKCLLLKNICIHSLDLLDFVYIVFDLETAPGNDKLTILEKL